MSKEKLFILYDGRACGGCLTSNASVLCTASSLKEARKDSKMFGDGAIYEYDVEPGNKLVNEHWIEDFGGAHH